ncbi:hypothetical protein ACIRG5_47430 [Lentzea sp. NPDC102401]|uniref:hypothetical protein n=1 Tax=Lentzea sp. NPDC102401 TaxID=3364128 RepID=UPI00380C04D7
MSGDTFDVHVLPVGPVDSFADAGTLDEAKLTVAALAQMGGRPVTAADMPEVIVSLSGADAALARWSTKRDGEDRSSALLWFGHGQARDVGAVLHVPRTRPDGGNAYVTPAMFAHHIHEEQTRRQRNSDDLWAVVVIEACNGRSFVGDIANLFQGSRRPPGHALLLVGSGEISGPGYLGKFRQALEDYLVSLTHHDQVFTLRHIADVVCRDKDVFFSQILGADPGTEFRLVLPGDFQDAGAMTVADQQRLKAGDALRSVPVGRVAAGASHLETTTRFAGRAEDLQRIADWAGNPRGAAVLAVTGPAGAGKSALLAEAVRRAPEGNLPGVVVLALTGSTPDDVVRRLAMWLGLQDQEGAYVDAVRAAFVNAPPQGQWLIVADALDEARDPVQVASVLRDLTNVPGVRLLVGTRPASARGAIGDQGDVPGTDLLEVLGSRTGYAEVWTVEPDAVGAREYTEKHVRRLAMRHLEPGDTLSALVRKVADRVESHVRSGEWQFLQATLVIQAIEERTTILFDNDSLSVLLESNRSGLFGAAVTRITAEMPKARAFLRALTYGHGRGLPRAEGIWAKAAAGLAGDGGVDDGDLASFLHLAAGYIMLDGEYRRSVYRLANRSFTDQLLETGDHEQERFGMFAALLELADRQARSKERMSPHLRSRLAEYASDCGAQGWAALAGHTAVLDALPMPSLTALALSPRPGAEAAAIDLPIEVVGTVVSAHLIESSDHDDRPGLRQLGGLRATGRLHEAGPNAAWRIRWGRLRRVPPHLQLEGVDGAVSAVAADPSARWLVTGSLDGTILVWEPWRRHHPTRLMRDATSAVSAIGACGSKGIDDVPVLLAAAHEDRKVRLWQLTSEVPTSQTHTSREVIRAIVALHGEPFRFVIAGEAGYVALLDAAGIAPQQTEPPSSTEVVGLVPISGRCGERFFATAQQSGHIGLWSADGPSPVLLSVVRSPSVLAGMATAASAEGAILVTTSMSGAVGYWKLNGDNKIVADVEAEQQDNRPRDLGRQAIPVVVSAAGRTASIFGQNDGVLMVTCPGGRLEPVQMGKKAIRAMTVLRGPHSGPVVAVTVERDRRVHFWDPSVPVGFQGEGGSYPVADHMYRHEWANGGEALVIVKKRGDEARPMVLDATNGDEWLSADAVLTEENGTCGTGTIVGVAAQELGYRVVAEVPLVSERGFVNVAATANRRGAVVLWRRAGEGWDRLRVIELGAACRGLVVLNELRLAVSTDDGVLVLDLCGTCSSDGSENDDE